MDKDNLSRLLETIRVEARTLDSDAVVYLVGSYATDIANDSSDIDLLIITSDKQQLAKRLSRVLPGKFPLLFKKVDCKIISKKDMVKARNEHFLMLHTMVSNGKLLEGKAISCKVTPQLLEKELQNLARQRELLEEMIAQQKDFDTIACLLFNSGKTLRYLKRSISGGAITLKEIFGNNLTYLGRIYEEKTRKQKGIQTSLTMGISPRPRKKRKMDYERLAIALSQLKKCEDIVKEKFYRKYPAFSTIH